MRGFNSLSLCLKSISDCFAFVIHSFVICHLLFYITHKTISNSYRNFISLSHLPLEIYKILILLLSLDDFINYLINSYKNLMSYDCIE